MAIAGVEGYPLRYCRDITPGAMISIIHGGRESRSVSDALWWLLLDRQTCKPAYKYSSFNTRSDKLDVPRAVGFKPYRRQRCLIPASAFVEGLGDKKTYHKIELEFSAIAFGGLYEVYIDPASGEVIYSASIITLPPLKQWDSIHPKSMPLMLDTEDQGAIDRWLDPTIVDVEQFRPLLEPKVRANQLVTKIDRPSNWQPIEDSYIIEAD